VTCSETLCEGVNKQGWYLRLEQSHESLVDQALIRCDHAFESSSDRAADEFGSPFLAQCPSNARSFSGDRALRHDVVTGLVEDDSEDALF